MKIKAIATITACAALLSGCGGNKTADVAEERVEQVRTTPLAYQEVARQIELSTTLQGYDQMNISPSLTGLCVRATPSFGWTRTSSTPPA